jgi:predicted secreted Zn-dependent protease
MEKKKNLYQLHDEHVEWMKHVDFFRDEVQSLENRLGEVVSRNTDQSIRAQVESFQNKIIVHKEQFDIFYHDVKQHENELVASAKANPTASDHRLFDDHSELRDRYNTMVSMFGELKDGVYKFVSPIM